jgi:hypothetical protein
MVIFQKRELRSEYLVKSKKIISKRLTKALILFIKREIDLNESIIPHSSTVASETKLNL